MGSQFGGFDTARPPLRGSCAKPTTLRAPVPVLLVRFPQIRSMKTSVAE